MRIGRIVTGSFAGACIASAAPAACPTSSRYTHSFAGSVNDTQLSYAGTYTYTAASQTLGSAKYTVSFTANGITAGGSSLGTLPEISNAVNGGTGATALIMGGSWGTGRTPYNGGAGLTGNTRVLVTTLTFSSPVRDVTFTIADIDAATDYYRDWIRFVGVDGANSHLGNVTATGTTTPISARAGPQTTPVTIVAGEGVGTASAANNTNSGNMAVSFAQPVRVVQLRYGNYPYSGTDNSGAGSQFYALLGVSWCPLPTVTVAKTSATWSDPFNGRTNAKAIPGGDVVYTLSVTGARSTVETPVLVDALPANLTFFNGDMNDAGAGTANYEFDPGTSNLTLAATGISYFDANGAAVTPAAGYDARVRSIRIQPTGVMAADSNFTVRFRAQVR